ncbi:spore germination protein [Pseudalkalibacillus hwajinpoensis]|uniref:spore germination protein n=1 Tax=Guptibacillus hwajinpoensis TaxID=208199 RepID=UPI00325A4528
MKIRRRKKEETFNIKDKIKADFHNSNDLQHKSLQLGSYNVSLLFLENITDKTVIQKAIITPLLSFKEQTEALSKSTIPELLPLETIHSIKDPDAISTFLIDGYTIILVTKESKQDVHALNTAQFIKRKPEEPVNEPTISGPRDGFIEAIDDNKALLRMHLKTKDLLFEKFTVGTEVSTHLFVAYIKGKANVELIEEIKERISLVKAEYIGDAGVLEQLLERNHLSVFPELTITQHPTKVANALMEGRVSILTDGSPTALIAPTTLNMLLQVQDDYYFKWIPASFLRILSFVTALISVLLPATYISFVSFHHGLIPTGLAISLSKTREGVPFPSVIEAFLMEFTIEILRQAGVRLPKPIGSTVSIVGAIVIGETAVSSGIVSPMMVMVISFTAICSFTVANYELSLALRTIRFFILLGAATLGIYGMLITIFIVTTHLVKLRSFTVPYLEPFGPYYVKRWKDSIIRFPFRQSKDGTK